MVVISSSISMQEYEQKGIIQIPERAAAFPAMKVSSVPLGYRSGEIIPFRMVLDTRAPSE